MDALMAAAASGIQARIQNLDILANNLANASAAGFKSDQESYGLYVSPEAADSPEGTNPAILPLVQNRWTDFTQGALVPTGNSMDLALSGKGFFVVSTPSGPLYTRGGSFRFSHDRPAADRGRLRAAGTSTASPSCWTFRKTIEVLPMGRYGKTARKSRESQWSISRSQRCSPSAAATISEAMRPGPAAGPRQARDPAGPAGEGQLGFHSRGVEHCDDPAPIRGSAEGHDNWCRHEPARRGRCRQGQLVRYGVQARISSKLKKGDSGMIRALYSAASGMNAQQTNIDNIANNLANSTTNGFKMRRAQFQDLIYQSLVQPGAAAGAQTIVPSGLQIGLGTTTGLQRNHILPRQLSRDRQSFRSDDPGQWLFSGSAADRPDSLYARRRLRTRQQRQPGDLQRQSRTAADHHTFAGPNVSPSPRMAQSLTRSPGKLPHRWPDRFNWPCSPTRPV